MQPEDSKVSLDQELKAFYEACIVETRELSSSVEYANRTSLRMAPVTALDIIYGAPPAGRSPYIYMAFDIAVKEPTDLQGLEDLMGFKHVDGVPDLTMRVACDLTEHSKGTRYDMNVHFMRDPQWRHTSQPRVLRKAEFASLRLYHVFDLLRISKQAARKFIVAPDQHIDEKLFPFLVGDILRPYSSNWDVVAETDLVRVHPEDIEHIKHLQQYTSSKFNKRWYSEESLKDDAAGPARLHRKPTDGGPFFLFPERATWLRDNAGHAFSLQGFCTSILGPSNPPESYAKIVELVRYENYARPKHQFVTLRAQLKMEDMPELDFWIRIDRSADLKTPHRKPSDISSSVYTANDQVKVNDEEDKLIADRSSCHPLVQSQYPASAQQASLREISKVLRIFSNESTNYVLLTENCWYLAALVQEFVAMNSGHASGDKATRTWATKAPTGTRKRILDRWNDNRSDTSLVEVQDESDFGSTQEPSVHSLDQLPTDPLSPAGSRQSTFSKASWLIARLPGRSSTAKSVSNQYAEEPENEEPENIIYEDSHVQTDEGEPGGSASRRKSKRSLSRRVMTIITLGKGSVSRKQD